MSYWIPFRKKEEKEKNKPAMLSLETMFRLQELTDELEEAGLLTPPRQSSLGFYCGFEQDKDVKDFLPFDPPEVIRMKKEDTPELIASPRAIAPDLSSITLTGENFFLAPEEYILHHITPSPAITLTGILFPTGPVVTIFATLPGSPYGEYKWKDAPENPRLILFIRGSIPA